MEKSVLREDFIKAKGRGRFPVLLAYPVLRGGVKVWCCYCRTWHHHTAENGHRVAHCGNIGSYDNSPFEETGYIIKLVGKNEKPLPNIPHNGSDIA